MSMLKYHKKKASTVITKKDRPDINVLVNQINQSSDALKEQFKVEKKNPLGVATLKSNTNNQIYAGLDKDDKNSTKLTMYEIRRLGARFKKLDSDGSGTVSLNEFFSIPEIKRNALANRFVEIFDTDGNGEVDFREFIIGMSQFSAHANSEGRFRMAFRIYDLDNNGFISNGELFQVMKTMVGKNLTDVELQQAVDHTFMIGDKDGDGRISFKEFVDICRENPHFQKQMIISGF